MNRIKFLRGLVQVTGKIKNDEGSSRKDEEQAKSDFANYKLEILLYLEQ